RKRRNFIMSMILSIALLIPLIIHAEEQLKVSFHKKKQTEIKLLDPEQRFKRYTFSSGYHFDYPDAVRGIYVTGPSVGGDHFQSLLNLVDSTDLNAMVIDIKDDFGYLTFTPEKDSPFREIGSNDIKAPEQLMKTL